MIHIFMMYQDLHDLNKYLENNFLPGYNVRVVRTKLKKEHDGEAIFNKNKFLIKINKNLSEPYSIDVLLHEWGHIISWDKESDLHGLKWGKAYSKVYRKFLEWLDEKN